MRLLSWVSYLAGGGEGGERPASWRWLRRSRGCRGVDVACGGVSRVPRPWSARSGLTCHPCVVVPAQAAVCSSRRAGKQKGTERAAQSTYRVVCPRGVTCALHSEKVFIANAGVARLVQRGDFVAGGFARKGGHGARAHARSIARVISRGTISLSFSAVVWPVARRHRSTARRRAAATASLRRAAPRTTPATRWRTGG